jgi:NEDD8-activating enzyme E1 regulatory subunit
MVTERDLTNNFFVTPESLGQPRAQVVSDNLKELNPDVEGDYIIAHVHDFIYKQVTLITNY